MSEPTGQTVAEFVREIFPDADDDYVDHILWEHTGYPMFFDLRDGETAVECLRRQLIEYKNSLDE